MNPFEAVKRIETLGVRNAVLRSIVEDLKQQGQKDIIWEIFNDNKKEISRLDVAIRSIEVKLD